jgi:MoaA/NifB/PqqE/SkfB family radical SAM enzyme
MSVKEFILRLVSRFQPTPLDKPLGADVPLAESSCLGPILERLRLWDIPRVTFITGEDPEVDELLACVEHAAKLGLAVGVRGRGTDLVEGTLLHDLAAAGTQQVEVLFLSAVAEIHDALAGGGDHRSALRALALAGGGPLRAVALAALVPSTWKTIDRTLEFLAARGILHARLFAIACPDEEPSSWALGTADLVQATGWAQTSAEPNGVWLDWCLPVRFNPAQSLAEQARHGPRSGGERVLRVEPDGRVIAPRGPFSSAGNLLIDTWESLCAQEAFRVQWKPSGGGKRCAACPGLAQCAQGCLREAAGWADGAKLHGRLGV